MLWRRFPQCLEAKYKLLPIFSWWALCVCIGAWFLHSVGQFTSLPILLLLTQRQNVNLRWQTRSFQVYLSAAPSPGYSYDLLVSQEFMVASQSPFSPEHHSPQPFFPCFLVCLLFSPTVIPCFRHQWLIINLSLHVSDTHRLGNASTLEQFWVKRNKRSPLSLYFKESLDKPKHPQCTKNKAPSDFPSMRNPYLESWLPFSRPPVTRNQVWGKLEFYKGFLPRFSLIKYSPDC